MSDVRHKVIKVNIGNEEKEVKVIAPTARQKQEAQRVRNKYFAIYVKGGAMLSAELDNVLKERGIWTDEMAEKYKQLDSKITNAVSKLWEGGDLDDAARSAFDIRKWRAEQRDLIFERSMLINNSAEGQAENMAFNYLVSVCAVYNDTGQSVFADLEDYLNRSEEEYVVSIAQALSTFEYETNKDLEKELPENEFLVEYGFLNEDLRRIDENGRLIDIDGNLINENGMRVDEEGHRINGYGQRIDEDNRVIAKRKPFSRNGKVVKPKKKKVEKTEDSPTEVVSPN